ncbi:anaerobic ribonucleoside-triphosphate reductase activating protein [Clostridium butyricum]|uniref:Anaerobic ribonucleoside-triphosphate reductase-activating protein n=1 Tax=Clostridium butyricum E4 str. BoNT E BL5262 TaxID=632245 RepID=C4IBZ2_CLOBU|nr:anaerobic ribonucleoside-triphosphate reductase activating protein [Clostridium butyricum]EDT73809.1 anaerobic ribonucleoside-triphosphate reductase activating protein [Clostridium butyricum 5521]EEP56027.1 anaerobic ribonucleoside-triphosphate reductase activating protein [Clostridium butyricum E4 str. BoNT E BL5262]NFL33189.1 anaerobic ribonucleoside-triphosphate reductase activating protein [Clostridium butyricum]NFS16510.1 anaerobic ribonucleoside-triphosphate reductase activating protei
MYYSKIKFNDVANGPGLRLSLFTSGCTHHCKGCFQPETWNFKNGESFTLETQKYIIEKSENKYIAGLSLLGGDPLDNVDGILPLLQEYRKTFAATKSIWLWTGYLFEEILKDDFKSEVLPFIDVIIDGKFEENLKDITLKYKGSTNQRVIDVKKSVETHTVILYE